MLYEEERSLVTVLYIIGGWWESDVPAYCASPHRGLVSVTQMPLLHVFGGHWSFGPHLPLHW